jgi:predicted esterase
MSRTFALLAFLLAAPIAPAFAQTPPEKPPEKPAEKPETKDSMNRRAVETLQAGKLDEGIAILTKALETYPKDSDLAYNLACGWSRKGDVDKGFEWLGKAVDWGWGKGRSQLVGETAQKSHLEMTKTDPDFANLRKDPRWEAMLDRIAKVNPPAAADAAKPAAAAAPASYIPAKAAAVKQMPLLVVLHDAGATKEQVVAGRWKAVADELGYALLAPEGPIALGDASKGTSWYAKAEDYPAQALTVEKGVADAVAAFAKDHPIDRAKTVLVGEGSGALVAMNIGLTGLGAAKGVVTVNGKFSQELFAAKAPAAGKAGVRVELLLDGSKKEANPADAAASQTKLLQTWGLAGEARVFTPDPKDPDQKSLLAEAVRSVVTPPVTAPAPAAAPK